jgi:flagellar basal body-associated protein FliL
VSSACWGTALNKKSSSSSIIIIIIINLLYLVGFQVVAQVVVKVEPERVPEQLSAHQCSRHSVHQTVAITVRMNRNKTLLVTIRVAYYVQNILKN